MTAKEYIEQLFTRHAIDWLDMRSMGSHVIVSFLGNVDDIRATLDNLQMGAFPPLFTTAQALSGIPGRCSLIIKPNPIQLQERTLTQAFENILRSTRDLHTRFGTTQDIAKALQVLLGEVEELRVEVAAGDTEKALHESLDAFVTLISFWVALGVDDAALARMMDIVAGKNDAKDDTTHVLHEGVITRRDKLV